MLNFKLTPDAATYISNLLAERPIKEAGLLALEWERQGNAEMQRLNTDQRIKIFKEVAAERKAAKQK